MFVGHYAVGFAARPYAGRLSLGTLFLAVQFVDLLWPVMLLTGLEQVRIDPGNTVVTPLDFVDYPITHSALTVAAWAIALGGVYYLARRGAREAAIVIACVCSHWLLDLVTHRPDLPLVPWGDRHYGLGLWNSTIATLVVELGLFGGAVLLYARRTTAVDRTGRFGLWTLVAFLGVVYVANVFGPPPPGEVAVAVSALALWLLVPWAYWIDWHRTVTTDRR